MVQQSIQQSTMHSSLSGFEDQAEPNNIRKNVKISGFLLTSALFLGIGVLYFTSKHPILLESNSAVKGQHQFRDNNLMAIKLPMMAEEIVQGGGAPTSGGGSPIEVGDGGCSGNPTKSSIKSYLPFIFAGIYLVFLLSYICYWECCFLTNCWGACAGSKDKNILPRTFESGSDSPKNNSPLDKPLAPREDAAKKCSIFRCGGPSWYSLFWALFLLPGASCRDKDCCVKKVGAAALCDLIAGSWGLPIGPLGFCLRVAAAFSR